MFGLVLMGNGHCAVSHLQLGISYHRVSYFLLSHDSKIYMNSLNYKTMNGYFSNFYNYFSNYFFVAFFLYFLYENHTRHAFSTYHFILQCTTNLTVLELWIHLALNLGFLFVTYFLLPVFGSDILIGSKCRKGYMRFTHQMKKAELIMFNMNK